MVYHAPQKNVNEWQEPAVADRRRELQVFMEDLRSSDALGQAELRAANPQLAYANDVIHRCHMLEANPDIMDALDFAVEQPWEEEEKEQWG